MNYENPTGRSLFAVDLADALSVQEAYTQVSAKEVGVRDGWFRDAIAENPELIM